MVNTSHDILEGDQIDPIIGGKELERRIEADNLLGAPLDGPLRSSYPGGARSTSLSNLRDIDASLKDNEIQERLPSVGSLNPYIPHTQIYNIMMSQSNSKTSVNTNITSNGQTTSPNESENPLFTLANSVPNLNEDKEDYDSRRASSIPSDWLNQTNTQSGNNVNNLNSASNSTSNGAGGDTSGNSHVNSVGNGATAQLHNILNNQLAMQLLAQSITQETSEEVISNNSNGNNSETNIANSNNNEIVLNISHPDNTSDSLLNNKKLITTTSSNGTRLFVCDHPECGKTFSRKMNLMSHYQSAHEHKKPFICEKCGKAFSRHSDRRRHEKSQHSESNTYVCGGQLDSGINWGCGKVFKRKDGLTAHWKSGKAKKKCFIGLNDESHRRLESDLTKS